MLLALAIAFSGMSVWSLPVAAQQESVATSSPELIVRFQSSGEVSPTVSAAIEQLLNDAGAEISGSVGVPGSFRVRALEGRSAADVAATLRQSPEVVYVEFDEPVTVPPFPARFATEPELSDDWVLDRVRASEAWRFADGTSVVVAVLDTGVSPTHPELVGRVLPGHNVIDNSDNATDDQGHGTYVAGLIAAANDGAGITGIAPASQILPVKVLNQDGYGSTAGFAAGIVWAVDAGADVINISAGGVLDSQSLYDAAVYAEQRGAVVVAATGNDGVQAVSYPAALATVLGVSASDQSDAVASFSTYGSYVSLAAPGVDVQGTWWSPVDGDGYTVASGTSAAAPLISGAAALVLQSDSSLTAAGVRQVLTEAAIDIESPGLDVRSGFGLLDAYLATRIASPLGELGAASISTIDNGGVNYLSLTASGFAANEPVAVWVNDGQQTTVVRDAFADSAGVLIADLGPRYRFAEGTLTVSAFGERSSHSARTTMQIQLQPVHPAFMRVDAPEPSDGTLFFPETGHTLTNGFRQYWESHGGLAVFGYPISEEFTELNPDTGQYHTVQYFERNRFEYHSEHAGTPWEVSLGRIGAQVLEGDLPSGQPPAPGSNARYFPETGHTLAEPFLYYWETRGGLELFGYPLSEPFEEGGRLVQYFERNRFEYHPELPGEHQVLLTRFGVDLARQAGYLN